MIVELNKEEYLRTLSSPMVDVSGTAEAKVDIWPHVAQLVTSGVVLEYVYEKKISRSGL